MSKKNMFEEASRMKLRFNHNGVISAEDLWDLPLSVLDSIYKNLNAQAKLASEESLLKTKNVTSAKLELQIEIIKYIVSVKQEEANAKVTAKEISDRNKRIKEILKAKEDEDLAGKTAEELRAMLVDEGAQVTEEE